MISLHETCLEYFRRRLSEGWKCVGLKGHNAVLLSPDGIRRPIDLRNDVLTLRPNGAGDEENITYATKPHWSRLNDQDDTTYIYEFGTTYKRDLYQCQDSGGATGDISSLTFYIRMRGSGSPVTAYAKPAIKIGATAYNGNEFSVFNSAVWVNKSQVYNTSPATGVAWTWAEIDSMQIGLSLNCSIAGDVSVCSEIWVEVTYTPPAEPVVTTQAATNVSFFSCTGNGNITNIGADNPTRRGFCYMEGTSGDPTTADSVVYEDGSFGTGAYALSITGLSPNTGYRVRAYAVNSAGTGYGSTVQVTTLVYTAPIIGGSHIINVVGGED